MKTLLWVISIFAVAVGLTQFAQFNTGYALLFIPPWRVELSLNMFMILLAVLVVSLYAALRLLRELMGLPGRASQYRLRKNAQRSLKLERDARVAFFEGRYQRAERLATEAMAISGNDDAFAVNALLAARAAHQVHDFERRDRLFAALREKLGATHLATAMTMAELFMDERRFDEASVALAEARSISPKLTAAMRLELRLRQRENDYDAVLNLVEQLSRADALDNEQVRRLRVHASVQKLREQKMSARELKDFWRHLPETDRLQAQLVEAMANSYLELGEADQARELIEKALEQEWESSLAVCYGDLGLQGEALNRQLQKAESWLKSHPNDASLLLALGRLCRAHALWGKAQNYLEASLAVQPSAVAHAELGQLFDSLERKDEANQHYRASLDMALSR